jgi:hypothetical protein
MGLGCPTAKMPLSGSAARHWWDSASARRAGRALQPSSLLFPGNWRLESHRTAGDVLVCDGLQMCLVVGIGRGLPCLLAGSDHMGARRCGYTSASRCDMTRTPLDSASRTAMSLSNAQKVEGVDAVAACAALPAAARALVLSCQGFRRRDH